MSHHLPEATRLRLHFIAAAPQRLPPLPTTAFHGAFGHALRRLACLEPKRPDCTSCPHRAFCAYAILFEAEAIPGLGHGVTTRAPAPFALSPVDWTPTTEPIQLERGQPIAIEVALIGAQAAAMAGLVIQAMRQAGERGVGIDPLDARRRRPSLELRTVERVAPASVSLGRAVHMQLLTPLRIKDDGKVRSAFSARALWTGLVRRCDLLARAYGGALDAGAEEPRFELARTELQVVQVMRYSSRQGCRVCMPGVVGHLELEGELAGTEPMWAFGMQAQFGKACTFGLGHFSIA